MIFGGDSGARLGTVIWAAVKCGQWRVGLLTGSMARNKERNIDIQGITVIRMHYVNSGDKGRLSACISSVG